MFFTDLRSAFPPNRVTEAKSLDVEAVLWFEPLLAGMYTLLKMTDRDMKVISLPAFCLLWIIISTNGLLET